MDEQYNIVWHKVEDELPKIEEGDRTTEVIVKYNWDKEEQAYEIQHLATWAFCVIENPENYIDWAYIPPKE